MKKLFLILSVLTVFRQAHAELPKGFVYLSDVNSSVVQEIRYQSSHNFVGTRVDGYLSPVCILTRQAAEALGRVQQDLELIGFSLKVYDCYRPQKAVDHFVRWAKDPKDTKTKAEFYPGEAKETLFKKGFIASKSGHSRGSTVDLTIIPYEASEQEEYIPHIKLRSCENTAASRFGDNSIDMGTGFDCFSPLSATENESLTEKQLSNRFLLKDLMKKYGFVNYEKEWWHYTLEKEPFPKTFFNFDVK
ncbi:D-alanyl-D-alanine dipeptidase [Geovibrio thiophilus]|uniref:D-alanyl-D-alanine dipeptidase n=1 Tax=Geovibrio thiophilus TaxID=139438 RepID=A0A410JVI0_9BACT|nr:M15 family metallopeptidase [Geovibrio thiophilus]QAR32055.1 D-alanyl-D-alanine dipeptidase [Geovibrio thiophilus]